MKVSTSNKLALCFTYKLVTPVSTLLSVVVYVREGLQKVDGSSPRASQKLGTQGRTLLSAVVYVREGLQQVVPGPHNN